MIPNQLLRAVAVATKGELVAPRKLLKYLLSEEEPANFGLLSARQREILGYVVEVLSNAEIARRLFLSESTIKQHLRAAYKLLEVNNRSEAANLISRSAGDSPTAAERHWRGRRDVFRFTGPRARKAPGSPSRRLARRPCRSYLCQLLGPFRDVPCRRRTGALW
jgi:DNA-binding CsgD family transcriptional regulator